MYTRVLAQRMEAFCITEAVFSREKGRESFIFRARILTFTIEVNGHDVARVEESLRTSFGEHPKPRAITIRRLAKEALLEIVSNRRRDALSAKSINDFSLARFSIHQSSTLEARCSVGPIKIKAQTLHLASRSSFDVFFSSRLHCQTLNSWPDTQNMPVFEPLLLGKEQTHFSWLKLRRILEQTKVIVLKPQCHLPSEASIRLATHAWRIDRFASYSCSLTTMLWPQL
jgi:hypothetical protein